MAEPLDRTGTPVKPKEKRAATGFALFLKDEYKVAMAKHPNLKHADVMKVLAGRWKAQKGGAEKVNNC